MAGYRDTTLAGGARESRPLRRSGATGTVAGPTGGARHGAERQAAGGHLPATTAARLVLADLLLRWGKPDSALREATEAERLARSQTLTGEIIPAGELRGRALIASGE